jgi:hypothetical protein
MIVTAGTLQTMPIEIRHGLPSEYEVGVLSARTPCTVSGKVVMVSYPVVKQPELELTDHMFEACDD